MENVNFYIGVCAFGVTPFSAYVHYGYHMKIIWGCDGLVLNDVPEKNAKYAPEYIIYKYSI